MKSVEATRTLVKSVPELWRELSDQDSLRQHLSAFGDVTIIDTEPERMVVWESTHASGSVALKPSGWGTRVTLEVSLADETGLTPQTSDFDGGAAVESTAPVDESLPTTSRRLFARIRTRFAKSPAESLPGVQTAISDAATTNDSTSRNLRGNEHTGLTTDEAKQKIEAVLNTLGTARNRPFSREETHV